MNIHKFVGSPAGGTVPGSHRQRAAKACFSCAESKLRCEGGKPCRRCVERGLPCRFPQKSRPEQSTRRESPCSIDKSQPTTPPSEIVVFSGSTNRELQSTSTPPVNRMDNDNHSISGLVDTVNPTEMQVASGRMFQELQDSPANRAITPISFGKGKAASSSHLIDLAVSLLISLFFFPAVGFPSLVDT